MLRVSLVFGLLLSFCSSSDGLSWKETWRSAGVTFNDPGVIR